MCQILICFPPSRRLQNHYETLNLPSDCTTSEIRNSYLKLSKEVSIIFLKFLTKFCCRIQN